MELKYKLGFIGAGNMAKAISDGIIKSNYLKQTDMIMSRNSSSGTYNGIEIITDNNYILQNCEYVVLAVKPQIFKELSQDKLFENAKCSCVISIMAGVKSENIQKLFNKNTAVIRVMPNTPCSVGEGMVCIAKNKYHSIYNNFVNDIFACSSKTAFVEESLFDAVTSISGSGPAYVYYFIKAMIDAGVEGGLSFDDSKLLTLQTIKGAVKMVENSSDELSVLIDKVCSKGGTTIQAIDTFRQNEMDSTIKTAIKKCKMRSEELSK